MKIVDPPAVHHQADVIRGEAVAHDKKLFRDIKQIYKNPQGMEDNAVMYEVYTFSPQDDTYAGHLNWGLTVMYPILVNGECNMTRGHFHNDLQCAEIYYGSAGEGLLVYMDEQGGSWAEKVFPGSVHYIKGCYAHRLVNTGDDVFKVTACWSPAAGHNYEKIEKKPFPKRFFKLDGKLGVLD